jgi:hypothetical protein
MQPAAPTRSHCGKRHHDDPPRRRDRRVRHAARRGIVYTGSLLDLKPRHPRVLLVHAMGVYSAQVLDGTLLEPYNDERAGAFARAFLGWLAPGDGGR